MNQLLDIILATSLLICLIYIGSLFRKNIKLKAKIDSMKSSVDEKVKQLEKEITKQEEMVSIEPGDRAIVPDYGLTKTSSKGGKETSDKFKVTYEVEILEVSVDTVKVRSIDFSSSDSIGKDPKNRSGILDLINNTWISKKEIELVIDDSIRRDRKLQKLGI